MQVFQRAQDLLLHLTEQKNKGLSIGFVPTMGALHDGHLALAKHCLSETDLTVVSIFVNPTQFNNTDDLDKYPRDTDQDIQLLKESGVQIAFVPSVKEMYPNGAKTEVIDLNGVDNEMEGRQRPGHFAGVATVVKRLFEITVPSRAYFGQKDYQQLLVIKQLVKTLKLPIEIIGHPIERSEKGLALSSRNERLTAAQKEESLVIWQSLKWAKDHQDTYSPEALKAHIYKLFETSTLELEYVEINDAESLKPLQKWEDATHARIFIAALNGKVRLIDNLSLF